MKLKCEEHNNRVMVLEVYGNLTTVHRKNGKPCGSQKLNMGEKTYTPKQVANRQHR